MSQLEAVQPGTSSLKNQEAQRSQGEEDQLSKRWEMKLFYRSSQQLFYNGRQPVPKAVGGMVALSLLCLPHDGVVWVWALARDIICVVFL